MLVLGLTLGHDSGAALCIPGGILAAVNEERLTRVKLETRFPASSIRAALAIAGIEPHNIESVVWSGTVELHPRALDEMLIGTGLERYIEQDKSKIGERLYYYQYWHSREFRQKSQREASIRIGRILAAEFGITAPLYRMDHHLAHASAAFFTSGFENALVVTADGQGDGISGSISLGVAGRPIKFVRRIPEQASIGFIYMFVTEALGFKSLLHEGKITGLAAYGNPERYVDVFRSLVQVDGDNAPSWNRELLGQFLPGKPSYLERQINKLAQRVFGWDSVGANHGGWRQAMESFLKSRCDSCEREDWAAAVQRWTEEITANWVKTYVQRYSAEIDGKIVLGGGLFANVKLNQRIGAIAGLQGVYIHPHMGDGGNAVGAALAWLAAKVGIGSFKLPNVYLGPCWNNEEIQVALDRRGSPYSYVEDIEPEIARLIAAGRVVARFDGAMEYGPRALGNRSILYRATDPAVNQWLNQQLKRSEFMPFAPAVLAERAGDCFLGVPGKEYTAHFMNITFDCSTYFRQTCPASVHIDGTARPQLVDAESNGSFYRIIQEYEKLTGIPAVINTSFNMHEEPIVYSPQDAIRAFELGRLDVLAIGDYIVEKTT